MNNRAGRDRTFSSKREKREDIEFGIVGVYVRLFPPHDTRSFSLQISQNDRMTGIDNGPTKKTKNFCPSSSNNLIPGSAVCFKVKRLKYDKAVSSDKPKNQLRPWYTIELRFHRSLFGGFVRSCGPSAPKQAFVAEILEQAMTVPVESTAAQVNVQFMDPEQGGVPVGEAQVYYRIIQTPEERAQYFADVRGMASDKFKAFTFKEYTPDVPEPITPSDTAKEKPRTNGMTNYGVDSEMLAALQQLDPENPDTYDLHGVDDEADAELRRMQREMGLEAPKDKRAKSSPDDASLDAEIAAELAAMEETIVTAPERVVVKKPKATPQPKSVSPAPPQPEHHVDLAELTQPETERETMAVPDGWDRLTNIIVVDVVNDSFEKMQAGGRATPAQLQAVEAHLNKINDAAFAMGAEMYAHKVANCVSLWSTYADVLRASSPKKAERAQRWVEIALNEIRETCADSSIKVPQSVEKLLQISKPTAVANDVQVMPAKQEPLPVSAKPAPPQLQPAQPEHHVDLAELTQPETERETMAVPDGWDRLTNIIVVDVVNDSFEKMQAGGRATPAQLQAVEAHLNKINDAAFAMGAEMYAHKVANCVSLWSTYADVLRASSPKKAERAQRWVEIALNEIRETCADSSIKVPQSVEKLISDIHEEEEEEDEMAAELC
ncbi:hypothetical protein J8273_0316 [Carpediemonas membranifera]|uniref:Uncharacterized protein n=1 Tax=Carpediemonas membranifera TaxID=201153 RepID=A0A8J6AVB4_9EUKA|nr:hypothetical protein J8273_0316 [Carpediemonas membranifera]|eukprot:KAG9395098.1 hypothetical protein J8273_0316 [Carpediemonas membranifera]